MRRQTVRCLFCLICVVAAWGQIPHTGTAPSASDEALEQRADRTVREYNDWRLSLLGNPGQIEDLRRLARNKQFDSGYGSGPSNSRSTLAKFGDRNELEAIICEAYSKDSHTQVFALRKLADVGGYTSIKALADIMLNDPPIKQPGGDSSYLPMRANAAISLQKLVPEMPISRYIRFFVGLPISEEQAREWYNWIMEHREQLGRLQPNETIELDARSCAERQSQKKKHAKRLSSQPAQH